MDGQLEILEKDCGKILTIIKKKKNFPEVKDFWVNNSSLFRSTRAEWKDKYDSNIFLFVKEYSSLLLRYMLTWESYDWNVKEDLELVYNRFLINLNFWGKYIVDSYLKMLDYNNHDQLRKDEDYIISNIKNAKELWVKEKPISELCKSYINKCIIVWIFDEPSESRLRKELLQWDKDFFLDIDKDDWVTVEPEFKDKTEEEVKLFKQLTSDDGYKTKTNDFKDFENNDVFNQESEVDIDEDEIFTVDDDSEIENNVVEYEDVDNESDNKKAIQQDEEKAKIIDDSPILKDDTQKSDKYSWVKIIVISSETQMKNVWRAFSQSWLNEQEKLKWWPFHIDFRRDIKLLDWFSEAPKTSVKTIVNYDMIIIGQNDHLLKDMPAEYSAWQKKDWWIKACLQELYNLWEWRVYYPEKNKRPDLSVTKLRTCLCDFMDRRIQWKTAL